jgi:hypothetical protein
MAWAWFKSNIKLPFNIETLKSQSLDIAYNQGLPGVISSLEQMASQHGKGDALKHPMWGAVKQFAQGNDPETFVQQAGTALQNSGQADEIIKHIQQ